MPICRFLIIDRYSYTVAFCSTLKELQDLASQHELIAENLRERSVKQIQITIKECREQRKKYLDDYNKIKRQLDKQQDLLVKVREAKNCQIAKLKFSVSYRSQKVYFSFFFMISVHYIFSPCENTKNVMILPVVPKKVMKKLMKISIYLVLN